MPDGLTTCPACGDPLRARRPALAGTTTRSSGLILDGRFKIQGFVDKGATARVYVAEDLATGEPVVVKRFAPTIAQREAVRARFPGEARALGAIDHPNVVRVISAGEHDGDPYVVMEALDGETLGERLQREGALPVDVALDVTRAIARGLAAAHDAGVVHRDVKPENVFLVGPSEAPEVKVIDFGMAHLDHEREREGIGLVLGTMQYMAPEQALGEAVDERSDVYALGVLMFRALTGHLPFDAKAVPLLLGHQLFSPAPPPSWLDEDLDPRIETVILCAMRKHPENRYATMHALLRDLDRTEAQGWPLVHEPDVYEPVTDDGREAVAFVAKRFRVPSSAAT
jgi:serine/threonine-protein kinase